MRVVAVAGQQPSRGDRQLPRARHPDDVDVVRGHAVAHEGIQRPVDQPASVIASLNRLATTADPAAVARRRSREFSHQEASRWPSLSRFVFR